MKRPPHINPTDWRGMSKDERRALIRASRPPKRRPVPKGCSRPNRRAAPVVILRPATLSEAFCLHGDRLMRRQVANVEVVTPDKHRYIQQSEGFSPCGRRVRFQGRLYSSSSIIHYLRTGEFITRPPRPPAPPRYKAQLRIGNTVRHIGYFPTPEARDAAIFAYRLTLSKPINHP